MIAIKINDYLGIGDRIQFSLIPENIFYLTGEKIYDINNSWVFDYNPFVERGLPSSKIDKIIDPWEMSRNFGYGFKSHAERFFDYYNKAYGTKFKDFKLRHPRLYAFENNKINFNRILIHTTGKSERVPLSDEVIDHIEKKYKNYEIIQIGGKEDKPTPFIQKLGLSIWETVELISSSIMFIGVNSGMMNIANCYPRVWKKILLPRDLESFTPLSKDNVWFDYNNSYYNYTEDDIGATFSYLKI